MRSRLVRLIGPALVAGVALAACGSSGGYSGAGTTSTTADSSTTTAAASAASATVTVVSNATIGKSILVDDKGMTLYVWDNDKTAGKAGCTGACATAWPPLDVTGTPSYGTGLTAGMFSTVTGPNGEDQLAVGGKPLYRWINDKAAGDATGQGVNGFYVVGSDGKKIDAD